MHHSLCRIDDYNLDKYVNGTIGNPPSGAGVSPEQGGGFGSFINGDGRGPEPDYQLYCDPEGQMHSSLRRDGDIDGSGGGGIRYGFGDGYGYSTGDGYGGGFSIDFGGGYGGFGVGDGYSFPPYYQLYCDPEG